VDCPVRYSNSGEHDHLRDRETEKQTDGRTARQIERQQKEGVKRDMPSAWAVLPPKTVADEHGGDRRTIAAGATVTADHHHPPTRTSTSSSSSSYVPPHLRNRPHDAAAAGPPPPAPIAANGGLGGDASALPKSGGGVGVLGTGFGLPGSRQQGGGAWGLAAPQPAAPAVVPAAAWGDLQNKTNGIAWAPTAAVGAPGAGWGNGGARALGQGGAGRGRVGSGSWGGGRGGRELNPFPLEEATPEVAIFNQENNGINFDAYEDIPVETSGENIPQSVNTFAEIDLGPALNENIRRCKYVKPTPVQKHAIPISLAGRDLMACAQTGSGKTAAFCFPTIASIMRNTPPGRPRGGRKALPLALILSPTRELSCQVSCPTFSHLLPIVYSCVFNLSSVGFLA